MATAATVATTRQVGQAAPLGSLATEPGAGSQWHLLNTGQTGGVAGIDIRVAPAWASATGLGVRIGIVDDGFDLGHPDLAANFRGGYDFAAGDTVPAAVGTDRHGTTTAGVIGADDNGSGLLGVAHDAQLLGYRVAFGTSPLSMFTAAMAAQADVDVSSNSWGFTTQFGDDFASPGFAGFAGAIAGAATQGRGGLGTVFVVAAGNERTSGDSVNHHNFLNSEYVAAIAALDASGRVAWFSNPGAALLAAAPGVGILTTDRRGADGYAAGDTALMDGTSYAAPMVAGIAALMLQANPGLGYRDVQAILAASARLVDAAGGGWVTNKAGTWNGGGQAFSNDYGFGLVDATAALRLAETWFATGATAATAANRTVAEAAWAGGLLIPDASPAGLSVGLALSAELAIERMEIDLSISHTYIGDLRVALVSPSGTESVLLNRPGLAPGASGYGSSADDLRFTLSSNAFRGEEAGGLWRLVVSDLAGGDLGTLDSFTLRAIGRAGTQDDTYLFTDAFAALAAADPARRLLSDAGGIDTINAAAVSAACVIDLAGLACSIGGAPLSIAAGTLIEHAIGGDGADLITGNQLANILWGGRGADRLSGLDGDDTLKGGLGADILIGGAGTDRALFDIARAAATLAWDGATLLVDDGWGVDQLSGIEWLVFADQALSVASIAPPPDLAAAIRLTNGSLTATAAGQAWTGSAPAPGTSQVLGPAQLGITGVTAAQVTLASAADGALTLRLDSAWNTLKVATLADADGGRFTVSNFVEAVVDLTGATRDSAVELLGAKRGSITGGSGADVIAVRSFSNNFDGGNTITVNAGDGADQLTLTATSFRTVFRAEGGAGDDVIVITGASADIVNGGAGSDRIDAGGGNDRITGGTGADVFVLRAGAGADRIEDFAPGLDRLEFAGLAASAVAVSGTSAGVRLAWGTDSVLLAGVTLAQFQPADMIFA